MYAPRAYPNWRSSSWPSQLDGYNLWEAPDNVSMAAVALAIGLGQPASALALVSRPRPWPWSAGLGLGLGDRAYQRRAPVAQHGLTVGYEHALDRQLDKRAKQLGKFRPVDVHVIQPALWAHS
jgi:hypothetical protein